MSDQKPLLRAIGLSVFLAWTALAFVGFIGNYFWNGAGVILVAVVVGLPVGAYVFLKTYR